MHGYRQDVSNFFILWRNEDKQWGWHDHFTNSKFIHAIAALQQNRVSLESQQVEVFVEHLKHSLWFYRSYK